MPRSEQLVMEFPPLSYVLEGDRWVERGVDPRLASYEQVPLSGLITGFYLESTIDLAGFYQDEDTVLIPQMYLIQDPGVYQAKTLTDNYVNSQGIMYVTEIVSTRKLDMSTVLRDMFNTLSYAGSPFSIYDKQQIVLGEDRVMMPNLPVYDPNTLALVNSPGIGVLNRQSSFGYAEKIANQKLFAYRIVIPFLSGDGDLFLAPPLRIRLEVLVDNVSSAEYVFALKRNVELNRV